MQQHKVTHAFLVPTMLARLLDDENLAGADLSSLEGVTYGAAPMPPSVIRRAIDVFPRSVSFSQSYGQTETTATVAVLDPDDHRIWEGTAAEQEVKLRRLRSVGKVLDDRTNRLASLNKREEVTAHHELLQACWVSVKMDKVL